MGSTSDPWMSPRVWFVHSDDSRVIQVQKDRFIFNWRRRNDEYPSFDVVYPEFQDYFAEFRSALKELQLPRIMPNRLELKYINIIDENITLDSYGDLTQIFPDFCWRNDEMRFLPSPRNLHLNYHFDLPDNFGSILFSLKSGTVKQTDRRVLQLEITAQGMSPDTDAETLGTWFNLAHEWIVCAFEDMTSQEIQTTVWRRR